MFAELRDSPGQGCMASNSIADSIAGGPFRSLSEPSLTIGRDFLAVVQLRRQFVTVSLEPLI